METAAILVHSLNRFSLCTKMAAMVVAKLLLCCDIICKHSIDCMDRMDYITQNGFLSKCIKELASTQQKIAASMAGGQLRC